jgi:RNA polymerase sigma-70 factor (ECF subfamily)
VTGILVRQVAAARRRARVRRTAALPERTPDARSRSETDRDVQLDLPTLLAILPDEQRDVIVLREIEQLSYQEIADALGIPRGTVESRIHRARSALRERFGEYGSE